VLEVLSPTMEYGKCSLNGKVYDDPRNAVGVGYFDEVGALAEA